MGTENRVNGAALHKRVEKELRVTLAGYGLNMADWTCTIEPVYENNPSLLLYATFKRQDGAEIGITDIYTDRDGYPIQFSRPELG